MMITSAAGIGRLSGSVTVPSMAAAPDPDCAAAGPATAARIRNADASARDNTRNRDREIKAERRKIWVITQSS